MHIRLIIAVACIGSLITGLCIGVSLPQLAVFLPQDCNVALVTLNGYLSTTPSVLESGEETVSSDEILAQIRDAESNPKIKAVLFSVNSGGGSPLAGMEIAHALASSSLPSATVIRDMGASAAYWAALGSNVIVASNASSVGSIGVIASYQDISEKNKKEGVAYTTLSTGKFKDLGDQNRPLLPEERLLVERDLNLINLDFINAVSTYRDMSIADVTRLADGSTLQGNMALEAKLIDIVGGLDEATAYLSSIIGAEATICYE